MIRRLRLVSGLMMLAYVTMHLANHLMSLISLAAIERVLSFVCGLWSTPPAQFLLYGSFLYGSFKASGLPLLSSAGSSGRNAQLKQSRLGPPCGRSTLSASNRT